MVSPSCCEKLPQLRESYLFIRETNEPVMAIRGTPFYNFFIPIELCMSLSFFLNSFVHIC